MPTDGEPVAPALRAQLLATEHWGLLAARGLTWAEVMSRITVHLTVSSASLVVLALVTQASGFGTGFQVLSIGLTAVILVLGTLTALRVHNASVDDAAMIIGMNRIRAGYLDLDPGLAAYIVADWHDDMAGVIRTYTLGAPRTLRSHVVGSTSMYMTVVNGIVAGTLGALIADAAGGATAVVVVAGVLAGLADLALTIGVARRSFSRTPIEPRFRPRRRAEPQRQSRKSSGSRGGRSAAAAAG
jgi:hypothetical protein